MTLIVILPNVTRREFSEENDKESKKGQSTQQARKSLRFLVKNTFYESLD